MTQQIGIGNVVKRWLVIGLQRHKQYKTIWSNGVETY